jgi:hypothetical protein
MDTSFGLVMGINLFSFPHILPFLSPCYLSHTHSHDMIYEARKALVSISISKVCFLFTHRTTTLELLRESLRKL